VNQPAATPQTPPAAPVAGERWTHVTSFDGAGPYQALVPAGGGPLFPRAAMDDMTRDMDHLLDIYGGLGWADDAVTVLIYRDADDENPRRVRPDARGLYDLGLDDFWVEAPA
jgi:hypothetical protein